jgi:hypothetical protein
MSGKKFNWKTFLTYFKARTKNGLNKKKELILSTLLVLVFLLGTLYAVPPFQTIMDWGERFTESWEKKAEIRLFLMQKLTQLNNFPRIF